MTDNFFAYHRGLLRTAATVESSLRRSGHGLDAEYAGGQGKAGELAGGGRRRVVGREGGRTKGGGGRRRRRRRLQTILKGGGR